MDNPIEEIKQKLNIVDVLSEYIKLIQAGVNYKCRCPFHNEKTPSFFVSQERQIWHCFGCGKGGDIFSFVQEMEGLEFPETLRVLAKKAGVKLRPRDPAIQNQKTKLLEISKWTTAYYHKVLLDSSKAKIARDYLKERQVSDDIIEEFKLGYAILDWDSLNNFLKQKDFKDEDIFLAGLTIKKEKGVNFYDRFRGRLMFPVFDIHGETVGFSGRLLEKGGEKEAAKYINTPQTLIYNKSQVLYGINKAKSHIKEKKQAIVVEGNMDVLASYQAEVKNVVASSGTALTREQVNLLKRYTENIAFAFDKDSAGEEATRRALDQALKSEVNVKIIELPFGKDPDECIRKDKSLWHKATENASSVMEYYFNLARQKLDLEKIEGKKEAAKMLLSLIIKLSDSIEQTHYLQELSSMIKIDENILRDRLNKFFGQKEEPETREEEITAKPGSVKERSLLLSERILALVIKFNDYIKQVVDNLESEAIDDKLKKLYKKLTIHYNSKQEFNLGKFRKELDKEDSDLLKEIDVLALLADKEFAHLTDEQEIEKELTEMIKALNKDFLLQRLKSLSLKIKESEKENNAQEIEKLSLEFNKLTKELKSFS